MKLGCYDHMAGVFEISEVGEESYVFRLKAADGTVMAVSPLFTSLSGAATGIAEVREHAATGLIVDRSAAAPPGSDIDSVPPGPVPGNSPT